MNFFYVMNGRKIKQVFIMCIAVLFAAGILYSEKGNITVFSQGEPSAVYSVETEQKVLALTFDISWGDKRTEPILQILQQKGVKNATFFLSSPWSQTHPEIVKKIVDSGYEIGSHGHKHVNYSGLSEEEIRKQIETAHTILTDLTGKSPTLIRMPNGDFDKRVLRVANDLNYKVIQWDTDSLDWMNKGVDNIINRVVTKAHPGDIVLLHASDSVKQTHEALPTIIDQLRSKGYEFVTVGQLLQQTNVTQKEAEKSTIAPPTTTTK
ncbi:polysaccharide deacetylase family sporulation protein PdaB [Paenibacillus koleovorans]|uniref:polysaccharide deacetylase family sporulation protein PdaB n=1 Tax=Paenibacillus koleovorans TaxID=121608 RepID=UPI000FDCB9FA|nr:polysaccharide deacetylase family sporulation protein PdaB [Paenibacillus koleovorans]